MESKRHSSLPALIHIDVDPQLVITNPNSEERKVFLLRARLHTSSSTGATHGQIASTAEEDFFLLVESASSRSSSS